jgi:endonuclease YncB( thermonuclease family)
MPRAFPRLRRFLRRAVYALLLIGLLVAYVAYDQRNESGRSMTDAAGERVVVADGDTIRIGARTIRLAGIDAVEYKQFCAAADGSQWSCGTRAREALVALVEPGGLTCEQLATDQYGRAVSTCRTRETADLGAMQVLGGWAVNQDERDGGPYTLEEARAAAEKRGIWVGKFEHPRLWRARHKPAPVTKSDI